MTIKRTVVCAAVIAAACSAAAIWIADPRVKTVIICGVIAAASCFLYRRVIRPMADLRHEAEEAREENEQLSHMRSDFVANVTHELKTPLTSISGFVETLQGGAAEDPEVRKKFLDIIAIETTRLKRMISDILVLSEIESSEEARQEKIDVQQTLEDIITVETPHADEKHIQLITHFGTGLVLRGSRDRLEQMIINIVDNAIKYSDEESRVWISSFLSDGHVIIKVKDEGIGIAQENIPRLFERFYRVDESRSRQAGGTGLGLSIVKHIASLFNASIHVDSTLGEGTEFTIRF
jgi:two-component system phosphate regulon sensor histidine kinase PhoR